MKYNRQWAVESGGSVDLVASQLAQTGGSTSLWPESAQVRLRGKE